MRDLTEYNTKSLQEYMISMEKWMSDEDFDDDYRIITSLIEDIKTEIRDRKIIKLICEK